MKHEDFNKFLDGVLDKIKSVLAGKSADYSTTDDKLYNFKLQGKIDNITPIQALRGNHLKHRASICQGLDELQRPPQTRICRHYEWWEEKTIDDINYLILQLAMLYSGEF